MQQYFPASLTTHSVPLGTQAPAGTSLAHLNGLPVLGWLEQPGSSTADLYFLLWGRNWRGFALGVVPIVALSAPVYPSFLNGQHLALT